MNVGSILFHRTNLSLLTTAMSSVQALRQFIVDRLTAAAGEIFTAFEQTIVQYEEEIDRQRRVLDVAWKAPEDQNRDELPHHHCPEEQLLKQEINYHLEQEAEHPQIKEEQEEPEPPQAEEHEELCRSPEEERLMLNLKRNTFRVPLTGEETYLRNPEEIPDNEQFVSYDYEVPDSRKHIDSESAVNFETKTPGVFYCDGGDDVSEKQAEGEGLCEEACSNVACKKCHLYQNSGAVTDKKKVICEICDKSFSRRSTLLRHKRIHMDLRPYSCEACRRSFREHSELVRHEKTHKGERLYCCETCRKGFNHLSNLLRHRRTHTGEKPYSCEICGKSFSQQSHMLRHKKSHKF